MPQVEHGGATWYVLPQNKQKAYQIIEANYADTVVQKEKAMTSEEQEISSSDVIVPSPLETQEKMQDGT